MLFLPGIKLQMQCYGYLSNVRCWSADLLLWFVLYRITIHLLVSSCLWLAYFWFAAYDSVCIIFNYVSLDCVHYIILVFR